MSSLAPGADLEQNKKSLRRNLTLRYMTALGIIACVILGAYFILIQNISNNEKDAYVVNISGMQRMLSQRIALLAREIHHAENAVQADTYAEKMREALTVMQDNHRRLSSGVYDDGHQQMLSAELEALYRGERGIDARVRLYTEAAEQFLNRYESQGLSAVQSSGLVFDIVKVARNGLLEELNRAVFQYQHEAETKTAQFKTLETLFVCIALLILFLEAMVIFRPMVKRVVKTTSELEEANTELLEFSYRISHDLRAPIISSQGLIDVVDTGAKDGNYEMVSTAVAHAKTSLKKLEVLIEDIINLTKMKMTEAPKEAVDIEEMAEEVFDKLKHMPKFETLNVSQDIKVDAKFLTKRLFLQQILENLFSNAIKYHDPDIEAPEIKVVAEQRGGDVFVSVQDNGLGIPEDQHEKIFGMFQRFHPQASFGSGLGLYLVWKNAQHLGGRIQYRALDKGSAFDLSFPYEPVNDQKLSQKERAA